MTILDYCTAMIILLCILWGEIKSILRNPGKLTRSTSVQVTY